MTLDDAEEMFESIYDVLVPYICERTDIPRSVVEQVLAAQADFWEERPHLYEEAMSEDEDD